LRLNWRVFRRWRRVW